MANVATITPLNQFFDTNGSPLNSGYLYFGSPNQDPEQFPVQMFWDAAGTVPALQPIRTISGYPSRAGSPAIVYGPDSYSLRVRNSASVQVLYAPELGGLTSSSDLAASGGSALIGFIQAGAGAVARTSQSKMRDTVCVFDFMTSAQIADIQANTALVNVTAAMQAAHNTGQLVYYPAGIYLFSTISFAAGGMIGDGIGKTLLRSTDSTSADLITYTGTSPDLSGQVATATPLFQDFAIEAANVKAGGAGIRFNPSSGELLFATCENIKTFNVPHGLDFTAASLWTVTNSKFIGYIHAGIRVQNTSNPDRGDSQITSCLFSTNQASGDRMGVRIHSSGGLKITGNKFVTGQSGIVLGYNGAVVTGDLLITGNSIENQANHAIYLGRDSGTSLFGAITITGNQIAIVGHGIGTDASGAIGQITVCGNIISLSNGSGKCVEFLNNGLFNISGNIFIGNGGAPNGVVIAAASANGKIGKNTYFGLSNTVSNNSTTTFVDGDLQIGTVDITHTTAFGALFYGSAAVVFPVPFTVPPTITCNAAGSPGISGGFAGYASNITTTGFTYNLVGVSSGTTLTNKYTAVGVI